MSPFAPARRPLTVIGGFLGAGKTTLLNAILARPRGRLAVLVNDFGAIDVDAGLVREHDGRTIRLANGCVCCSLADGFTETLIRVLDEPFDGIVVEASGVGDPAAIAAVAALEPDLRHAGTLVLLDAERLPALLADARLADTVVRQIRAADIAVLNKLDLVDEGGRSAALAALRALRPDLRVLETIGADVPDDILDLGEAARTPKPGGRGAAQPGRFAAEDATHEALFRRLVYARRAPFRDAAALEAALAAMPPALLRLKGNVRIAGEDVPSLLQVVGSRAERTPLPAGPDGTALVGIGTPDLEPGAVERLLDGALAPRWEAAPRVDEAAPSRLGAGTEPAA